MKFSLDTKIIKPENNNIKNAIILLHGYGGDGDDISAVVLNWKRFLPETIFLCPNGHEICPINPNGFQWFSLEKDDPAYILEESIKAENKLNIFINEIKSEYKLNNSKICVSGFSQGCMMSVNLGLTAEENFNCIVGFSGKIIDKENISKRIKSKTKMLLIHGNQDVVVPPNRLLEAKDFLIRHKVNIEIKMIENCGHHIPIEASSIALKYIKKNLYI
jgi:phospholipase/carboxylesterase|tara:strand:- start:839 stop:1492 length:654 start_codon:yes stop_codon:yes gene_type:complete